MESKTPTSFPGGFDGVIHAVHEKKVAPLSGLGRFETQILESGPSGLESPQIDRKEPSTGYHRFFARGSAHRGLGTKNMRKLLKAAPGWVPFL